MSEALLYITLFGTISIFILLIILHFLTSKMHQNIEKIIHSELRSGREESRTTGKELREEVSRTIDLITNSASISENRILSNLKDLFEITLNQLKDNTNTSKTSMDQITNTVEIQIKEVQNTNKAKLSEIRQEISTSLNQNNDAFLKMSDQIVKNQHIRLEGMTNQIKALSESLQADLERVRKTLDDRVRNLQDGNEKKLEEMRKTVNEKLQDNLNKRLGESFKMVSDRLEAVHQGLGEMQNLATGVGDLKRVLTNVKARGTWAEIQLGTILEQVLTPEQYEKNVCIKQHSSERVEFAIKLPGPTDDPENQLWLPIDSKFPQEDYLRLQEAAENGSLEIVQEATKSLVRTIENSAKDIHSKYINPPDTTDFAIMFLATEGLNSEILRQPNLVEKLQQEYRIVIAGPTTLIAILNSLRLGFQTLAIQKRASEVWRVLAAVKTEFKKFDNTLLKVKRQLQTASNTIDETGVRTRALERKLRSVEQLPENEASQLRDLASDSGLFKDTLKDTGIDDVVSV
ncbi:DNA recombination protein RmuC [Sulfidibacter corallicola]|uniref:DNA recombination protein RmuC n=1 Tax=Sulfidibacter corallicola TaxID=2818388 RepID=A0A8A4TLZ2_SULCO|nr:DNA recombination protein RmuC [Sulfidibacter corallicola]QTD50583.1 DNA recombination protein RmuC [Sulfidibacter corallicola]